MLCISNIQALRSKYVVVCMYLCIQCVCMYTCISVWVFKEPLHWQQPTTELYTNYTICCVYMVYILIVCRHCLYCWNNTLINQSRENNQMLISEQSFDYLFAVCCFFDVKMYFPVFQILITWSCLFCLFAKYAIWWHLFVLTTPNLTFHIN